MAAGSLVVMVLAGMLYWQYERVKFLENRPLLTDHNLRHPGLHHEELHSWFHINLLIYLINVYAIRVFQQFALGKKNWKQIFDRSTDFAPQRPVSQRLRVICAFLSVAGLACSAVYFAKIIHASVWVGERNWEEWAMVYPGFYFSMALLSLVVRDYQKFIHGAPIRTLPAEHCDSLRQAVFDGDIPGAAKLYRRAIPEVSAEEAIDYARRLEAELKAKQPEKFAPRKPWDLNWRLMGICLVVEAAAFAGFWIMAPPGGRLFTSAAGFLHGAGILLSSRLKIFWRRFLVVLGMLCIVLLLAAKFRFFLGGAYFTSLGFGAFLVASGFKHKRRKPPPIHSK